MAYPMERVLPDPLREGDCTDGAISEEIVVHRCSCTMGSQCVVRWHPRYGTVKVTTELPDGTRLKLFKTQTPEFTEREFHKSAFRRFIDNLLDSLHL